MNSQHFIEAIKHYIRDAAVVDTITNLRSPPGRRVSPEEQARSDWYSSLSATEADHVNSVIAAAVHEGLFGLLAAIDGARTIDDGRGKFELFYVANQRVLLNEPRAIGLHDLLNAST